MPISDWVAFTAYLFLAVFLSALGVWLLDRIERPQRRRAVRSRLWVELSADLGEHRWLYILGLISAVVGLALVLRVGGDWGNVGGELFGIALTVVVIAFLVRPHSSLGYRPPAPAAIEWPPGTTREETPVMTGFLT